MTDALRGKVARILDTRNLVINLGSNQGVVVGMYFDVLDPNGEDIKDPDTGEILGSVDRPKVRVQVIKVEERLSVASTYRKKVVNIGGRGVGLGNNLADMFLPPKHVTRYETLKTTEKTWENLDESESFVKTGDPVVQVLEEVDVETLGDE
ncbi:hypothetical protein FQZ97_823280 [compost metagenome]